MEGAAGKGQTFKQAAADPDTLAKILKARPKSESVKLLHAYCRAKAAKLEIKNSTKEEPKENVATTGPTKFTVVKVTRNGEAPPHGKYIGTENNNKPPHGKHMWKGPSGNMN